MGPRMHVRVLEIKSAKKRCEGMGRHHQWRPEFDQHALSACLDNYSSCVDVELADACPDYTCVLHWILTMARKINAYCDAEKVSGNDAAEYWLERFLWRCDRVCKWDALPGRPSS